MLGLHEGHDGVKRQLQDKAFLNWRLNNIFIIFVLNKGETKFGEYYPISFLSGVYKIIVKVHANSLKRVIDRLVSSNQLVGVEGRQIQANILLDNELPDSRWKHKEIKVMYNIDITKAFDHVSWVLNDYILGRMGFGIKWRDWLNIFWATTKF